MTVYVVEMYDAERGYNIQIGMSDILSIAEEMRDRYNELDSGETFITRYKFDIAHWIEFE